MAADYYINRVITIQLHQVFKYINIHVNFMTRQGWIPVMIRTGVKEKLEELKKPKGLSFNDVIDSMISELYEEEGGE